MTAITVAELFSGVAIMPGGRRKEEVRSRLESILALFGRRVFAFTASCAHSCAEAVTIRRRSGRSIEAFDLLIAAIARANHMAVATRNTGDSEDCGVELIDPWKA